MGFGDAWLGRGEKGGLNRGVGSVPARVSRRRPVRPSLAFFFCSAPASEVRSHFVMAAVSFAGGRGFCFFFGGISPDSMRSWTFTQRAKLSASPKSGLSEVRSRSPFFVSALWHSAQCFSMKIRAGASAPKVDRPNIPMEKAVAIRAVIATREMGMERKRPGSAGAKHTKRDREKRRFGGRGQRGDCRLRYEDAVVLVQRRPRLRCHFAGCFHPQTTGWFDPQVDRGKLSGSYPPLNNHEQTGYRGSACRFEDRHLEQAERWRLHCCRCGGSATSRAGSRRHHLPPSRLESG